MKKIYALIIGIICTCNVFAQNTIKFLGIPIDGTKSEMVNHLKHKGFTYDNDIDGMIGEFNGNSVQIYIQTVNSKVWRLCIVEDVGLNEVNIKARYNRLYDQFLSNPKYYILDGDILDDEDDISYEMVVHDKRYSVTCGLEDDSINGLVWYMIAQINNDYHIVMFYENYDNAADGSDL